MIFIDNDKICSSPIVSVFVFTYNQEKFIEQTLGSIVDQKIDGNYEIIICDDSSIDSTLDICIKYQKKYPDRIIVVENEKNLGLRRNFFDNILKYARGEFIACCAGDDWWIDNYKLEKQVSFLKTNPEYGLVHTKAAVYLDREKRFTGKTIGVNKNTFYENLLQNNVAALTMCYTLSSFKEYVKEVDPVNLPYSEDYPMILWYSYRSKMYHLDDITSAYRYLQNSVSHSIKIEDIYEGPKSFLECGLLFVKKFQIDDSQLLKRMYLRYFLNRMQYSHILDDKSNIKDGDVFFLKNRYYAFWLISQLYSISPQSPKISKYVKFLERIVRRLHPSFKDYR